MYFYKLSLLDIVDNEIAYIVYMLLRWILTRLQKKILTIDARNRIKSRSFLQESFRLFVHQIASSLDNLSRQK